MCGRLSVASAFSEKAHLLCLCCAASPEGVNTLHASLNLSTFLFCLFILFCHCFFLQVVTVARPWSGEEVTQEDHWAEWALATTDCSSLLCLPLTLAFIFAGSSAGGLLTDAKIPCHNHFTWSVSAGVPVPTFGAIAKSGYTSCWSCSCCCRRQELPAPRKSFLANLSLFPATGCMESFALLGAE